MTSASDTASRRSLIRAMTNWLLALLGLLAAGVCVLAAMDRRGRLNALWERALPTRTVPPSPSAETILLTDTQRSLDLVGRRITESRRRREALQADKDRLVQSLRDRVSCPGRPFMDNAGILMARDPVAAATIRAIATTEERIAAIDRELADGEAERIRLEAKLIRIRNGAGPESQADGPSLSETSDPAARVSSGETYARILCEAASRPSGASR